MASLQVEQALSATAQPVKDQNGNTSPLTLSTNNVGIGTTTPAGKLAVTGSWDGQNGALTLAGQKPTIRFSGDAISGNQQWLIHEGANGPGDLEFYNGGTTGAWSLVMSLTPDGNVKVTGDILLTNADCAEDFDIHAAEQIEPGTVMVLGEEGKLEQSQKAYDKRVAGVVSGAGDYKPGIVLDKQQSSGTRKPIALLGKVYCKVDAQYGAIGVGDLLTTAPTPGYAMKADDPLKAFGAVIGKALRPLAEGQGLIPILIALQ
jgi:hypothetical protein